MAVETAVAVEIAYLSASWLPSRSANAVHIIKMSSAFAARGHDVELYFAAHPVQRAEDPQAAYGVSSDVRMVGVARPRLPGAGWWIYGWNVGQALRTRRSSSRFAYGRHALALLRAARFGLPVFYEVHAPPETPTRAAVEARLFRHPNFGGLVAITQALAERYRQQFPARTTMRTLVAPDGATAHPVIADGFQKSHADRPRIGYAGSLFDGRGVEILLAIANALPDIELVVVGGSKAEIARWQQRAAPENIVWLGHRPHADIPAILQSCDVLLAPYQEVVRVSGNVGDTAQWMSPLKIFEYMAAGRAMIASDMAALREVLEPGATAVLVAPQDEAGWIAAARRLIDDPAERDRIGAQARLRLLEKYSWERRAERIETFMLQGSVA